MNETKRCNGCYQLKPIDQFVEGSDKCSECRMLLSAPERQFKPHEAGEWF